MADDHDHGAHGHGHDDAPGHGDGGGGHGHGGGGHDHASMDPELLRNRRGVRAVWVSVVGLGATALLQLVVVGLSGSSALFADALHNLGDVAGTLALWLGFVVARRAASDEFPYGWRRAEDLAGLFIVLAILGSAGLAGWDSLQALLGRGHELGNLATAFAAALVGIVGNEGVAQYKIRVGRQIDSVALIADGRHARTDGLASAAAAVGIAGAWAGFPIADPLAGLVITVAILWILVDVGKDVLRRNLDAVEPGLLPGLRESAAAVEGITSVHDLKARYVGQGLFVQVHAEVDGSLPLREAHAIGEELRHRLVHDHPVIVGVDVHVDPDDADAHAATAHHFGEVH